MAPRLSATARREQLLDVALEVFAERGFHETSMNDVAERAGVTKPVLYQHFQSKRELYQALLDEVAARMWNAISNATSGVTDGRRRTELGFRAYFRWVADDQAAFKLLYDSSASRDEEFSRARRGVTGVMVRAVGPLITADIDDEHRMTLAHALVGLAEGASRRLVEHGADFDADEVARQVSGLAWAGLRSVRRSAR
jgi:AcrR family transcriptional regulator